MGEAQSLRWLSTDTVARMHPQLDARRARLDETIRTKRAEMDAKFALVEECWNGMHRTQELHDFVGPRIAHRLPLVT